jgi:hypothetical protein
MTMITTGKTKTGIVCILFSHLVCLIRGRHSVTRTRDGLFLIIAIHSFTLFPLIHSRFLHRKGKVDMREPLRVDIPHVHPQAWPLIVPALIIVNERSASE